MEEGECREERKGREGGMWSKKEDIKTKKGKEKDECA